MAGDDSTAAPVVALDALDGPIGSVFDGDPRVVQLSLAAGEERPRHSHPDRVVVCHVFEGTLNLRLDGESHELAAGEVTRFDGSRDVAPLAVTDTRALLVLA